MWGIIPAVGRESSARPAASSRGLLPVGSRLDRGVERPRALSEHLVDRMLLAGATRICFVIPSGSSDVLDYYGATRGQASLSYAVQPEPTGLCDAIFRALPLVAPEDLVFVGRPDTIWFPEDGLSALRSRALSFLLFPVDRPEVSDAVVTDGDGRVLEIQGSCRALASRWVWGAFKLTGAALQELCDLWRARSRRDKHIGPLLNEYVARGGVALGVRAGTAYADVRTLDGYREAVRLLGARMSPGAPLAVVDGAPLAVVDGAPLALADGERIEPSGAAAPRHATEGDAP
ncbi:nucleotidyltransferase family protein [Sorangium sp. So ce1335]|uniref:nucleotidyltransferase family protein n=1 Tax=Sorangium sp. So ce1335 TaxID=3133335 RepID=UPI003F5EE9E5